MLKFTRVGPESGDCTAPYDVEWVTDERRTAAEFVAAVLLEKPDEWGCVYFVEGDESWMRAPFIEYKNGCVVRTSDSFRGWDDDREIASVTARGGWTNMDYYVRFREGEGTKEPAKGDETNEGAGDEAGGTKHIKDEGEKEGTKARKIPLTREELERNIAESILAVAEHVIENAETYAKGIDDHAQGLKIEMKFSIDALPTVTVTQDLLPRKWMDALHDGRCRIWTAEGRRELFEQGGDERSNRRTNEGPAHERRLSTKALPANEGNQRTKNL